MEALGAISDGVWSSLGGMYVSDEADFMAQLLGKCTFLSENEGGSALGVPSSSWTSQISSSNLYMMSGSAMSSSGFLDLYSSSYGSRIDLLLSGSSDHESYYNFNGSDPGSARSSGFDVPMDYCLGRYSNEGNVESSDSVMKEPSFRETCSPLDQLQCSQLLGMEFSPSGHDVFGSGVLGKRSRSPKDLHTNTGTRRSKVARRLDFSSNNEEEATVTRPGGPSWSPCHSEDDSSGGATCSSLSPKGSNLNTNSLLPSPSGKTRASRGSATDPQSLYARKRREKINDRLRILQSLVPNGTKVDISTMLEEAVHYVKFLQLQIKLLSSDELWMYAPIAYNGMDIGLNKFARGRQL